jgi:ketosteroid isomerase-like protein
VWEPASTELAERTPYRGHDGLRAYVADLDRDWEEFEITVGDLREHGPFVVAHCRAYARAGGFVADSPLAIVWEVRDGLGVWGKAYRDRAEALRVAGIG